MGYVESMLLKDETIIYTGRKHYALLLGQIVTEIILLGLTGVAVWLVSQVLLRYQVTDGALPYVLYGVLAVAGTVLLGSAVLDYLRWYNDCVVLTNRRIMKFEGLFNRHMIESSLNKINDVALNQTFFGRMIGYGDITILTAADTGLQEMRNIADPIAFKRALAEARAYDDNIVSNAAVAAMEDAVEDAMEHAVNDHREAAEQIVMGDAHRGDIEDRAPTPTANQRPTDEFLATMLTQPSDETPAPRAESHAKYDAATVPDDADSVDEARVSRSTSLLSQLDALHAAGILSDEEYAAKRQRITDEEA